MLLLHLKTVLAAALCAAAFSQLGLAQVAAPSFLQINVANHVLYFDDTDVSKFASDPNVTTPVPPGNFFPAVGIGGGPWPARDGDSYSRCGGRFSQIGPRPRPGNR